MDNKFVKYLEAKNINLTNQQMALANVILSYLNTDTNTRNWFLCCRSGKTFLFNTIENFFKEVIRGEH